MSSHWGETAFEWLRKHTYRWFQTFLIHPNCFWYVNFNYHYDSFILHCQIRYHLSLEAWNHFPSSNGNELRLHGSSGSPLQHSLARAKDSHSKWKPSCNLLMHFLELYKQRVMATWITLAHFATVFGLSKKVAFRNECPPVIFWCIYLNFSSPSMRENELKVSNNWLGHAERERATIDK